MYLAMRGDKRIVQGDDLDEVVIAAERFCKPGTGDIVVWENSLYIVAEIEDQGESDEPYTNYRCNSNRRR